MANKTLCEMWSPAAEEVRIVGRFFPQGASAPTIGFPTKRKRFSVVRTSAGVYTVTLLDKWFEFAVVGATLQLAALTVRNLQVGTIVQAAGTFVISNIDGAAAAQDVAADPNNSITFDVSAMNSSV